MLGCYFQWRRASLSHFGPLRINYLRTAEFFILRDGFIFFYLRRDSLFFPWLHFRPSVEAYRAHATI
jgi:hypothetical protein